MSSILNYVTFFSGVARETARKHTRNLARNRENTHETAKTQDTHETRDREDTHDRTILHTQTHYETATLPTNIRFNCRSSA